MPELDTLRGVAIISVLFFHFFGSIAQQPGARPLWQRAFLAATRQGWAGVNLFFILSGFLITGILLDSVGDANYFKRFYRHRAVRILPAYYLMLVVMVLWNLSTGVSPRAIWQFAFVSFIYLSNVAALFGVTNLYPLLWSLSVEEHFYLIWPAVAKLVSRRTLTILAVIICVVEPALRAYALLSGSEPVWAGSHHAGSYFYTWMTSDGLALGSMLALLARSRWGTRRNFAQLSLALALPSGLAIFISSLLPLPWLLWVRGTVVYYLAVSLVAGTLWLGTGPHRALANIRLLSFYGYISYGLYLVHGWMFGVYETVVRSLAPSLLPGQNLAKLSVLAAVCAGVATGLAYLSRSTYEAYFLRMKASSTNKKMLTQAAG